MISHYSNYTKLLSGVVRFAQREKNLNDYAKLKSFAPARPFCGDPSASVSNLQGSFYEHMKFCNPHTLYTEYKKLLRKLNLPDIRFHDLRHSYATAMIEQKIPLKTVSHMLGHSNISTTADIYCDVINSHQEGAHVAEKVFFSV